LARFADVHAIGFVTPGDVPLALEAHGGQDWVTVYFPHELRLRRVHALSAAATVCSRSTSRLRNAMRLAITAGLTAAAARTKTP